MKYFIILIFTIFIFTGCSPKFEKLSFSNANLQEVSFKDLKNFEEDNLSLALDVFNKACTKSQRRELFKEVCIEAKNTNNAKEFFTNNFTPYKLYNSDGSDKGVITGYYEPLLYGSYIKDERFKYPIYKIPSDLIIVDLKSIYPKLKNYRLRGKIEGNRLIPYGDREIIENSEEENVLLYVDNKIELYFLHIQGSGKIELPNGDIVNVGFANQNGRKYVSIGKYMLNEGYIGRGTEYSASVQGMKKWFDDNPQMVDEVLNQNPSYVFFEERKKGATGSLGVELVAQRNLAVDTKYIKLGLPVFINTKNPITNENIDQLMVAADTGGAIKGEIRADFFWGFSKDAEKFAGSMKEKGELYILVPKKSK